MSFIEEIFGGFVVWKPMTILGCKLG